VRSTEPPPEPARGGVDVAVVGGGVAGLACADRVRLLGAVPLVLERDAARAGGKVRTDERSGGFLVEWGPQTVFGEPELVALAARLRLAPLEQPKNERARFLVREGQLRSGLGALSARGLLRALWGFVRRGAPPGEDETVDAYARRRFGEEAARRLFDALVAGTFAGDARRLSYASALARFGRRRGRLITFEGGLEALPRALAASLGDAVRLGAEAVALERGPGAPPPSPGGPDLGRARGEEDAAPFRGALAEPRGAPPRWVVRLASGERIGARAVVVATPAYEAAALLAPLDAPLGAELAAIPYGDVTALALGYDARAFPRGVPRGFGFLAPSEEGLPILGCLYCKAPPGKVLLRVMMRGLAAEDAALAAARTTLARLLGATGEPTMVDVIRHARGIPQYEVGHAARLRAIDARLAALPGLFLAGNAYRGIAVPDVVSDARRVAERAVGAAGAGAEGAS
jgi:oxygen-dependent protoporphyrinogen oxidase